MNDGHVVTFGEAGNRNSPLKLEIETSFDDLEPMREEWDDFVEEVGGDIYLTYDWCRIWWKHYGHGRTLRIFLFRDKTNALEAIIPMFVERVWLGPVWLRIAKIVGSDFTLSICSPPVRKDFELQVYLDLLGHIFHEEKCDATGIGPLAGTYTAIESLREACLRLSDSLSVVRDGVVAPHTVFFLPQTFDDYLKSLPKRQRGNFRRDMNLLTKCFEIQVQSTVEGNQVEGEFQEFKKMHEAQWRRVKKLGHFGDWPRSEEFHSDLLRVLAPLGSVRLVALVADDDAVAHQLCFVFGDCLYWRLPARAVGEKWDRFAFGRVSLVKLIEYAIDEGLCRIEAGQGHYEYKVQLGGTEYPLRTIFLVSNQPKAKFRAKLFQILADLLHFLYYRIWFIRLSPRIRFLRRPLWRVWIRSRI